MNFLLQELGNGPMKSIPHTSSISTTRMLLSGISWRHVGKRHMRVRMPSHPWISRAHKIPLVALLWLSFGKECVPHKVMSGNAQGLTVLLYWKHYGGGCRQCKGDRGKAHPSSSALCRLETSCLGWVQGPVERHRKRCSWHNLHTKEFLRPAHSKCISK